MKRVSTAGYTPIYEAPIMIVLSAKNGNDRKGFNMAKIAYAAENMLLTTTKLELGS